MCEFSIGVCGTGCTCVFAAIVLAMALFNLNYLMAGWFYLAKEILQAVHVFHGDTSGLIKIWFY